MKAKVLVILLIVFIIWSRRFGVIQDISEGGKFPKMSYWFRGFCVYRPQKICGFWVYLWILALDRTQYLSNGWEDACSEGVTSGGCFCILECFDIGLQKLKNQFEKTCCDPFHRWDYINRYRFFHDDWKLLSSTYAEP